VSRPVSLVAAAGARAGLGHLARCSAVAAALGELGVPVRCHALGAAEALELDGVAWAPLARPEEAPAGAVAVIDAYGLGAAGRAAAAHGAPVVAFDDAIEPLGDAALRIRVAAPLPEAVAGEETAGPLLAGLAYAPLRRPFWSLPPRAVRPRVERVLVAAGGGAVPGAEVALCRAALTAAPEATVAVVRGPHARFAPPPGAEVLEAPPSLREPLLAADAVVTAAGQTGLEAAAAGTPAVAVPLAANQRAQAAALAAAGAAVAVEHPAAAAAALAALAAGRDLRAALARAGQAAVDGRGAARIAAAIRRLGGE
jgi:UDP-2,4-diacetamido-2,4,6-trideoxy-beta-L-altropyranose hydrolase